jgi:hypothetical protein
MKLGIKKVPSLQIQRFPLDPITLAPFFTMVLSPVGDQEALAAWATEAHRNKTHPP